MHPFSSFLGLNEHLYPVEFPPQVAGGTIPPGQYLESSIVLPFGHGPLFTVEDPAEGPEFIEGSVAEGSLVFADLWPPWHGDLSGVVSTKTEALTAKTADL
jgi:hypothetical protein